MVLPGEEEIEAPVLQLDLGFHDKQEDLIFKFHILAWRTYTTWAKFQQTTTSLNEEEEKITTH